MNATDSSNREHNDVLDPLIAAVREEPSRQEVDAAVGRFRARLPRQTVSRPARLIRWVGAATAAMLVIIVGPQLVPGDNGTAFAEVQAWFENYETVHVRTETHQHEAVLTEMNIWVTADGDMRLESGPIVQIFDPEAGVIHILLPGEQVMTVEAGGEALEGEAMRSEVMAWLEEIREFQGQAQPLADTRSIQGVEAIGYRLDIDQTNMVLWAESATNRPLLMEVMLPGDAIMRSHIQFDQPLPENAFSVPAQYEPVTPEG